MTQVIPHSDIADLEDLLASPGWQVFIAQIEAEWGGVGFARKVAQTIGNPHATPDPIDVLATGAGGAAAGLFTVVIDF